MPTMRIREFAATIGQPVEMVIDAMEALHAVHPKGGFDKRHQNSNITEQGQAAVSEHLAAGLTAPRPDGKPELPADRPADTDMRIVDFAEEIGQPVDFVCGELATLGEPHHHSANISPDAQDLIRSIFAAKAPLEVATGDGEGVMEIDPASPVPGTIEEFDPEYGEQCDDTFAEVADAFAAAAATDAIEGARATLVGIDVPNSVVPLSEALPQPLPPVQGGAPLPLEPTQEDSKEGWISVTGPYPETMPEEDRFPLVSPQGNPTGEYELLHPDLAARVREVLAERRLLGFRLDLNRGVAVVVSWPDGQKYEVPA